MAIICTQPGCQTSAGCKCIPLYTIEQPEIQYETLTPTYHLRYVIRGNKQILQQCFKRRDIDVWKDVPIVSEKLE